MELKFRPEDPYAHPAFGELNHSSDLVLRLSRKPNRKNWRRDTVDSAISTSAESVEDENAKALQSTEDIRAEIVAKVDKTYAFEGQL